MLFNVAEDPKSEHNRIGEKPELAREMHAEYVEFLKAVSTPERYLLPRRELSLE